MPMYPMVYAIFYLISLLPMPVLYVLSDGFCFIVYHVLKYRRKVVMQNLLIAFPEKTESERLAIAKKFYHNLIDSIVETIKLVSASKRFLEKRITANWEILGPLYQKGKSAQLHLGHTFNWEWGHHVLGFNTPFQVMVVYMPIHNAAMEKLMHKLRQRHGNIFVSASEMHDFKETYKDKQYLLGLVADQSPGNLPSAYWLNFFGKPTAFVSGPEKGARAGNLPVVFASIQKPKRGYYHAHLHIACEDPSTLREGELTLKYARFMEEVIRETPDMWLWSHRRWKREWKEEYRGQWIDSSGFLQELPGWTD